MPKKTKFSSAYKRPERLAVPLVGTTLGGGRAPLRETARRRPQAAKMFVRWTNTLQSQSCKTKEGGLQDRLRRQKGSDRAIVRAPAYTPARFRAKSVITTSSAPQENPFPGGRDDEHRLATVLAGGCIKPGPNQKVRNKYNL
ncbi:MAG TPA: hypothetical protein DEB09_01705 [Candidatus Magasanikbacteria bacterium]|nr:hypothetical protein [Candidatus Magasanikbacteria bacterium]